jgi:hypothetical protein
MSKYHEGGASSRIAMAAGQSQIDWKCIDYTAPLPTSAQR